MVIRSDVKECFLDHLSKYPNMQIQDIYKFVFQGVMGSGHAIQNEAAALAGFQRELRYPGKESPAEEVTELLSHEFVRINLRPFVKIGGSTDALFKAFVLTGRNHGGSETELDSVWGLIKEVQNLFKPADMEMYFSQQRKSGFPAVHHSEIYRELYLPSYRVISVKELSCLLSE